MAYYDFVLYEDYDDNAKSSVVRRRNYTRMATKEELIDTQEVCHCEYNMMPSEGCDICAPIKDGALGN